MATKWITVITDEAMQKICYEGGGWTLSPYKFAISETDVLRNITPVDPNGFITDDAYDKLASTTTADMQEDIINTQNVWCLEPFSSITKSGNNSLMHHIVVPANLPDVISSKAVKTIYFQYQANNGEIFLYAVAYAVEDVLYEVGITQSFYFNFTVSNTLYTGDTKYVVNYTYPQDISDHNTADNVHDNLLKIDGSRPARGALSYAAGVTPKVDSDLVPKSYVDNLIRGLISANPNLKLPANFS